MGTISPWTVCLLCSSSMASDAWTEDLVDTPDRRPHSFDWAEAESLAVAVLEAVEAATGDEAREIDPLYETVDPDALDELFDPALGPTPADDLLVEFPYNGVTVRLHGNGAGCIYVRD